MADSPTTQGKFDHAALRFLDESINEQVAAAKRPHPRECACAVCSEDPGKRAGKIRLLLRCTGPNQPTRRE